MSTKIEDLPSPNKETLPDTNYVLENDHSNVKLSVHKKHTGLLQTIKQEFNEENLLLLGLFFLASIPKLDELIKKLPVVGTYNTTIIKISCLLLVFVLCKRVVLPQLKM